MAEGNNTQQFTKVVQTTASPTATASALAAVIASTSRAAMALLERNKHADEDSDTADLSPAELAMRKARNEAREQRINKIFKEQPSQTDRAQDIDIEQAGLGTSERTLNAAAALAEPGGTENIDNHSTATFTEIDDDTTSNATIRSIGSFVCRICHNSENPERLVSPCYCKGSLTYVHIHCLERWISTSRSTVCELCHFQYNTEQTLRYTCFQSLRLWYSRSMSRRALQEDCQMFSLLTLVAFGIVGTLLVGIQYYFLQERQWGLGRIWTKGWLIFFLFTTLAVYVVNIYMIVRSQLTPWYRWWQSARDIKLILENRKPFTFRPSIQPTAHQEALTSTMSMVAQPPSVASNPQSPTQPQPQQPQPAIPRSPSPAPQPVAASIVCPLTPTPSIIFPATAFSVAIKLPMHATRALANRNQGNAVINIPMNEFF